MKFFKPFKLKTRKPKLKYMSTYQPESGPVSSQTGIAPVSQTNDLAALNGLDHAMEKFRQDNAGTGNGVWEFIASQQ